MSKISAPESTPDALTPDQMVSYVQEILVPIADKFIKNHVGDKFTGQDIEDLYKELNNTIRKDPRILDSWDGDQSKVRAEMASETAEEINKGDKLSKVSKLIQGFGNLCKKMGLGTIGSACIKYSQGVGLKQELGSISTKVASTKMSMNVGDSKSAKVAKPIENPKIVKPKAKKIGKHAQKIVDERQKGNDGLSR